MSDVNDTPEELEEIEELLSSVGVARVSVLANRRLRRAASISCKRRCASAFFSGLGSSFLGSPSFFGGSLAGVGCEVVPAGAGCTVGPSGGRGAGGRRSRDRTLVSRGNDPHVALDALGEGGGEGRGISAMPAATVPTAIHW